MTIRIIVDGWPYLVTFNGTVDIERLCESATVALRTVTPDSSFAVVLDQQYLDEQRSFLAEMRARTENWNHFWLAIISPTGQP